MHARTLRPLAFLLTALAACRADQTAAPSNRLPASDTPAPAVYPAASYAISTLPDLGWVSDVNDQNYMVGTISDIAGAWVNAFVLRPGGTPKLLSLGGAQTSAAMAVNTHGAIVGTAFFGWNGSPAVHDNRPAVWSDASSAPIVAALRGTAYDINDAGLVVGTAIVRGGQHGFVWDTTSRPIALPPLRGGYNTTASAINADRVILGASSSTNGWVPVLWRFNGSTWVPQAITGGINALALDDGITVVGQTAGQASFGKPDHAGFFAVGFQSYAAAVTRNGRVAVGPAWYPVPGPASGGNAFVADRSGAVTMLPIPNSWWTRVKAHSVNTCGLVVGSLTFNSMQEHPAYWNPGC